MTFVTKSVSLLTWCGFKRTAKFVEAIEQEGLQSREGREFKYGNFSRGLSNCILDPITLSEINRSINVGATYELIEHKKPFSRNGGTGHMPIVKELVERSSLNGSDIRIFDAACNHGYLASRLEQKIARYIGMDLAAQTIQTANDEASARFESVHCSDYKFLQGNILLRSSYSEIPRNNNLIVCTGVLGHFRPYKIKILLDNFQAILSKDNDSRIIINCPVIPLDYDSNSFIINTDEYGNIIPKPRQCEDGYRFILTNGLNGFQHRRYEKDDVIKLINDHGKFVIEDQVGPREKLAGTYLSLKRKN